MIPNCWPGHNDSLDTHFDLPRSNFEGNLYRLLCTMLFVMTSGDLNIDLTQQTLLIKVVGLPTSYPLPFAVCRYDSCFRDLTWGRKGPRPIPSISEPARNRGRVSAGKRMQATRVRSSYFGCLATSHYPHLES